MTLLHQPTAVARGADARRAALTQLARAADLLGLDDGMHAMVATPR